MQDRIHCELCLVYINRLSFCSCKARCSKQFILSNFFDLGLLHGLLECSDCNSVFHHDFAGRLMQVCQEKLLTMSS